MRRRLWALNFAFGYGQFHAGHYLSADEAFAAALRHRPLHAKTWLFRVAARYKRQQARTAVVAPGH